MKLPMMDQHDITANIHGYGTKPKKGTMRESNESGMSSGMMRFKKELFQPL